MNSKNHWYLFLCPECGAEVDFQLRDSSGLSLSTCQEQCSCGWQGPDSECSIEHSEHCDCCEQ